MGLARKRSQLIHRRFERTGLPQNPPIDLRALVRAHHQGARECVEHGARLGLCEPHDELIRADPFALEGGLVESGIDDLEGESKPFEQ